MKLLFATGNALKLELMMERLKGLKEIELISPKTLGISLNVIEDGLTPEENAYKKAKAYYDATKLPVIAEDSALYIDKFKDDEQPGLFVKRINKKDNLSDEEILKYYIDKLNNYGGESLAQYHTGVCVIDETGEVYKECIKETKFLFTTNLCNYKTENGGALEPISYDINSHKYFVERNEEDKKNHYKCLDDKYNEIVQKHILKR